MSSTSRGMTVLHSSTYLEAARQFEDLSAQMLELANAATGQESALFHIASGVYASVAIELHRKTADPIRRI
jgi:hypothetical protein